MIYWLELNATPITPTTTDRATAEDWQEQLGYGEIVSCLECEL